MLCRIVELETPPIQRDPEQKLVRGDALTEPVLDRPVLEQGENGSKCEIVKAGGGTDLCIKGADNVRLRLSTVFGSKTKYLKQVKNKFEKLYITKINIFILISMLTISKPKMIVVHHQILLIIEWVPIAGDISF